MRFMLVNQKIACFCNRDFLQTEYNSKNLCEYVLWDVLICILFFIFTGCSPFAEATVFLFFLICKNQHCAQFCKYDHHYNKEKESSSVGNVVIFLTQTNQNSMIFCQEMWDTLETLVALQFCFANLDSLLKFVYHH